MGIFSEYFETSLSVSEDKNNECKAGLKKLIEFKTAGWDVVFVEY